MKNLKIIICSLIIAMIPGFTRALIPSDQGIHLNDREVEISGVKHNGFNYYRLRDLAYILKDTRAQFEVGYDKEKKMIVIETKTEYTGDKIDPAKLGESLSVVDIPISIDKNLTHLEVVNVGGYNYFRLRDLGTLVGFEVNYNPENKRIDLVTEKEAEEDLLAKLKKSKTPIIYGRDSCPSCIKLKLYLDKNKIEYEYRSTEELKNKEELIGMGFNSVPQMIFDGEVYSGFNENILKELFEK